MINDVNNPLTLAIDIGGSKIKMLVLAPFEYEA